MEVFGLVPLRGLSLLLGQKRNAASYGCIIGGCWGL